MKETTPRETSCGALEGCEGQKASKANALVVSLSNKSQHKPREAKIESRRSTKQKPFNEASYQISGVDREIQHKEWTTQPTDPPKNLSHPQQDVP